MIGFFLQFNMPAHLYVVFSLIGLGMVCGVYFLEQKKARKYGPNDKKMHIISVFKAILIRFIMLTFMVLIAIFFLGGLPSAPPFNSVSDLLFFMVVASMVLLTDRVTAALF